MVVALTDSALYKKNAKLNYEKFVQEDYKAAWEKVSKALDYLIPILKQDALISSTNDMSTVNVLVPIVAFLLREDIKISESKKYGFLYWMFLSLIWGRYSGQTDQRLDKDVYLTINSHDPINDLVDEIEDQRGRIKVKPSDLDGRGSGHPLYRMLYIITKNRKAIDWSNGSTIYGTIGDYYSIHSHHIFPKSVLYKHGYDSENHLDKKKVNEIANRAFVTRDTNFEISDQYPETYLGSIEDKYPGALEKQFISMDRNLWSIDNYEAFLEKRRELIANEINEYLQSFREISEKSKDKVPTIDWDKIISKGENDYVEFKSSLRWDYKANQINKTLEYIVAKTISAFLNSEGGRLFIGVDDEENILGLENDYKTFGKKPNKDGFLLKLTEVINNYIGKEFHQYITIKIEPIAFKDVCIIESQQSGIPAFLKSNQKEEFFIRASASTQPMNIKEAYEYINSHWSEK